MCLFCLRNESNLRNLVVFVVLLLTLASFDGGGVFSSSMVATGSSGSPAGVWNSDAVVFVVEDGNGQDSCRFNLVNVGLMKPVVFDLVVDVEAVGGVGWFS